MQLLPKQFDRHGFRYVLQGKTVNGRAAYYAQYDTDAPGLLLMAYLVVRVTPTYQDTTAGRFLVRETIHAADVDQLSHLCLRDKEARALMSTLASQPIAA